MLLPHPWQFSLPTVFTIGQNAICIYISFFIRSWVPNIKNLAEMWQTIWNSRLDSTSFFFTLHVVVFFLCTAMFIEVEFNTCSEESILNTTHQYSELRHTDCLDSSSGFVHAWQSLHAWHLSACYHFIVSHWLSLGFKLHYITFRQERKNFSLYSTFCILYIVFSVKGKGLVQRKW